MKPLTLSEFRDALRKGKGRTYLHVVRHADEKMKNALVEACNHDLRYDRQCEDDRSEWTYSLLAASGEPDRYFKPILLALKKAKRSRNALLYGLAGQFARRGNEKARQAIRAISRRRSLVGEDGLFEAMMDADGLDGFLRAAEAIGMRNPAKEGWYPDYCFGCAKERFGEEKVSALLAEGSKHSSGVRLFCRKLRREQPASKEPKPSRPPLREVLRWIETGRARSRWSLRAFGRHATRRDIRTVFNRMIQERRPEVICRYLKVFLDRELPELNSSVLDWARSGDAALRHFAMVALSNSRSAQVRDLALERLNPKTESPDWEALWLLERNWINGDARWLRCLLPHEGDPQMLHGIGLNLLSIAGSHRDPALAGCLLWAYELTPCSLCRGSIVRKLVRLRRAPRWLLGEAIHDADETARQTAARALSGVTSRRRVAAAAGD